MISQLTGNLFSYIKIIVLNNILMQCNIKYLTLVWTRQWINRGVWFSRFKYDGAAEQRWYYMQSIFCLAFTNTVGLLKIPVVWAVGSLFAQLHEPCDLSSRLPKQANAFDVLIHIAAGNISLKMQRKIHTPHFGFLFK